MTCDLGVLDIAQTSSKKKKLTQITIPRYVYLLRPNEESVLPTIYDVMMLENENVLHKKD